MSADHVQRTLPNRAGRAENREMLHGSVSTNT
jgi:hypothetical protein